MYILQIQHSDDNAFSEILRCPIESDAIDALKAKAVGYMAFSSDVFDIKRLVSEDGKYAVSDFYSRLNGDLSFSIRLRIRKDIKMGRAE